MRVKLGENRRHHYEYNAQYTNIPVSPLLFICITNNENKIKREKETLLWIE